MLATSNIFQCECDIHHFGYTQISDLISGIDNSSSQRPSVNIVKYLNLVWLNSHSTRPQGQRLDDIDVIMSRSIERSLENVFILTMNGFLMWYLICTYTCITIVAWDCGVNIYIKIDIIIGSRCENLDPTKGLDDDATSLGYRTMRDYLWEQPKAGGSERIFNTIRTILSIIFNPEIHIVCLDF